MKIALIGYGKMGKSIETIALERNHEIVSKLSDSPTLENLNNCDIAIEFSNPNSAFDNISFCIKNNIPVISGTTGWLDKKPKIESLCEKENGAFIYGSNFSLGVNLFFELNQKLVALMKNQTNYNISLEEIHHTQKLDAPSGTAISLANQIISENQKEKWILGESKNDNELPIHAKREDNVPGTHSVYYTSEEDTIEIKHTAHSRKGFALGAVIAAEFLVDKKGIFTMKDVLNLN